MQAQTVLNFISILGCLGQEVTLLTEVFLSPFNSRKPFSLADSIISMVSVWPFIPVNIIVSEAQKNIHSVLMVPQPFLFFCYQHIVCILLGESTHKFYICAIKNGTTS